MAPATPTKRWHALLLALVTARRAGSLTLHCLLAWPAALLPSAAFIGVAYGLGLALGIDMAFFEAPEREGTFKEFFGMVVFAPLVETLLLAGLLALLSRMSRRPVFVAAASSVLWGCLHGSFGLLWLVGTFWSFYIFSCSYLAWRAQAWWKAYVAAALPHAVLNLTAFLLLLLD
ncbi:MAG: hypothetical protein ACT6S0_23600 [Roseateles sp.]|uniref:hypothetical protein n=1 Tax=Roseateles sp. TaxID=1971397 RepID=UPI00403565EC